MNKKPLDQASASTIIDEASFQPFAGIRQKVQDLKMLVKFRLTTTVVFSSVMAYLIASPGAISWTWVGVLALGGFLVTGAANALNQALEKDYDRLMKRTQDRPIAAGRMTIGEAVMAAGFMSLFGISLLALFNPWTAFLGTFSLVSYAFVYTPMKRVSPDAVFIGAIPGALPMLIGCVAAQGELTLLGLTLFGIQFLWQFPHFWSIGYLGYEDYAKAGYRLIPEEQGKISLKKMGRQALLCGLMLAPLGVVPFWLGTGGWVAAVVVFLLGLGYAYFAYGFLREPARKTALRLMFYSFGYIPLSLISLWVDKLI